MSEMYNEKFRRPLISFTEMLKKGASNQYREQGDYSAFMFRALVIACDTEGGKLETPTGEPIGDEHEETVRDNTGDKVLARYKITPTLGPINPKNSVRARIISNNMDQVIDDDNLRTYWPMFPGADTPSAGEVVYVVFEDEDKQHGLWLAKVPFPETADGNTIKEHTKNQILMSDQLKDIESGKAQLFNDSFPPGTPTNPSPVRRRQRLSELFL
jgi:hypothetical protein